MVSNILGANELTFIGLVTRYPGMAFSWNDSFFQPNDKDRTVPINCGYIGTNDYGIEIADREFMIRVSDWRMIVIVYNVIIILFASWDPSY